MVKTKKAASRKIVFSLLFFYLAIIVYILFSFLQTTLFSMIIPNSIFSLAKYLSLGLFILSIVSAKYTKKQALITIWAILLAILIYHNSGDTSILLLIAFLLSSFNKSIDNIVRVYMILATLLLIITMTSSLLGMINNYKYIVDGSTRLAFGFLYTTDFAAHVFYLCVSFAFVVRNKLKNIYILVPILLTLVVYFFTKAKLDSFLMVLVSITMFYYKFGKHAIVVKGRWILTVTPFLLATVSILFSKIYNANNHIFFAIDRFFTNRLAIGHLALYEYPMKFFGQYISQRGSGGLSFDTGLTPHGSNLSYFFIDSSYIKMLLGFGVVFFFVYLFSISYVINETVKKNDILLALLLVIICISSLIDHHMLEIAYNPFLVVVMMIPNLKNNKVATEL
ncbi:MULTISPECIES: hypothetical protein [Lactiplantibacillus]|uniref:hypothetical protein n=1 Tax=Lactiplantibacillus TaxID=2767842 RepID=UPI001BDBCA25|nr:MULTISPECIES: hypothetical protein [Lactiplantibacillus]MBT1143100.1 hypothetical protein [Lactiplantibacillus argentoratensis]MBT1145960.1 hypothetical protein [Lactiplantibacillus argentoratensis]MBT1148715.1 hypothetical protein [Lactiplantibacillus argentoratensis]MBT1152954.1 hypothetical protein [Lactiplantibacillus argentoratensis]MDV3524449.1 hypothetical protein [Lactiplantibacillus plantarum]